MHMWKGSMRTVTEIAKMEGVNPNALRTKVLALDDVERAVEECRQSKNRYSAHRYNLTVNGESVSAYELARRMGLRSPSHLYALLRRARESGDEVTWTVRGPNEGDGDGPPPNPDTDGPNEGD